MGKTADLTSVLNTTIDIFHKEGKTQKVTAKDADCPQRSVSKHTNRKTCGRIKCTSNRDNQTLYCETKPIQKCVGDSLRVD